MLDPRLLRSDPDRVAVAMIWSDGPWFEVCDADWRVGDFYKVRATYAEHPTYGPQLDIVNIRRTNDADAADGFAPLQYVPRTPFDVEAMYQELWMLAESAINDVPLRRMGRGWWRCLRGVERSKTCTRWR